MASNQNHGSNLTPSNSLNTRLSVTTGLNGYNFRYDGNFDKRRLWITRLELREVRCSENQMTSFSRLVIILKKVWKSDHIRQKFLEFEMGCQLGCQLGCQYLPQCQH